MVVAARPQPTSAAAQVRLEASREVHPSQVRFQALWGLELRSKKENGVKPFLLLIPDKAPGTGPKALGIRHLESIHAKARQHSLEMSPPKPVDINKKWLVLTWMLKLKLMLSEPDAWNEMLG